MRHLLNFRIAALALAGALGFSSCTTIDPYTGEQKASNAFTGATLGALAGGLAGAVIGNNTGDGDAGEGAAIGAALGGLAGAAIGNSMDQQEAMLRRELRATGVSVSRQGQNIILNMPSDITFATGSASVQPRFYRVLDSVATVLRKYRKSSVTVNGHTDSDGDTNYNMNLSRNRAGSVSQYLASRGVSGGRLVVRGFGESRPIASNSTRAGKSRNRRVEIHIIPR